MPPSGYQKFQEEYEAESDRAFAALSAVPIQTLLDRVREADFGKSYSLWHVIGAKATLPQAGWILFDVLNSPADYLNRYHCAAALIKISGPLLAEFTPVTLTVEKLHPMRENLAKVQAKLLATIGPRAESRKE